MTSLSDWAAIFGYLCFFLASLAAFYFLLPGPRGEGEEDPGWAFRRAKPAKPKDLEALVREADAHERYAPGHARRVADLALALADAVGLAADERPRLERAALLHDVGELEIPGEVLAKPGLLSQPELHRLWTHAARGAERALAVTRDPAVATWVRWSHERWDGLGYPDGLAGEQIPLPARILRLADSAEAMTQARPYRPAMRPEDAMAEIDRLAGIAYDPELARVFVDYVLPRKLGPGGPA